MLTGGSQLSSFREERLLGEFLAQNILPGRIQTRVRLGCPPLRHRAVELEPGDLELLRNFCRWADALLVAPEQVTIIEAKVIPDPGVISQLLYYLELFKSDPTYRELHGRPLQGVILCGVEDAVISDLARKAGLRVIVFTPDWLGKYLAERFRRKKPTPV